MHAMKAQVCLFSLSQSLCLSYMQATKKSTSADFGFMEGMSASADLVTDSKV
jgi:hypothetical protein